MTPTRSATPDSRLPELPAAVGPTHADYLAMTPAVLTCKLLYIAAFCKS